MKSRILFSLILLGALVLSACSATQPAALPSLAPGLETAIPSAVVTSAQQALATQLNLDLTSITIKQVEDMEWPDACLGIANQGVTCAQVITPGYKVILEANGQTYEVRTDKTGSNVQVVVGGTPSP